MVHRIYVEKKEALRQEAASIRSELCSVLGIAGLTGVRLINRYDVELADEAVFERAVQTVFSEPQVDNATAALPEGDYIAFAAIPPSAASLHWVFLWRFWASGCCRPPARRSTPSSPKAWARLPILFWIRYLSWALWAWRSASVSVCPSSCLPTA